MRVEDCIIQKPLTNAQANRIKMIRPDEAQWRREGFANNRPPDYGVYEKVAGTGRATCRECGEKIAKGVDALRFAYDFTGSGSWTVVEIQVHLPACPKIAVTQSEANRA